MANLQFEQIVNAGLLYLNGMGISNDATTPNTVIDISAGQCRDSTNEIDIILGNFLGANPNQTANTATLINGAINGAGGLDTGALAASTMYQIFVIADPQGFNQASCIISAASATAGPLMPHGYGVYRYIGSILTDSSSHFLLTYYTAGSTGTRYAQYDAPVTVTVTSSGTSTTYSALDLSVAVPLAGYRRVQVQALFTPAAASNTLKFQPTGGTGDYITYVGQVSSVGLENSFLIYPLIASSKPEISYKVSAGTLTSVQIQGYEFSV